MRATLWAVIFAVGVASAAPAAIAHSVGWSINPVDEAVVLQFSYGGGDPMAFVEVTVQSPDGRVYQKGRADRAGKFAVVIPADAADGEWSADVVDSEGHSLTARFTANSEQRVTEVRAGLGKAMGVLALILLMATILLSVQLWNVGMAGQARQQP